MVYSIASFLACSARWQSNFAAAIAKLRLNSKVATLPLNLEAIRIIGAKRQSTEALGERPQQIVDNLLIPLARDWDGFSAAAHEFIASGKRVVSLGTYAGTFKTTGPT